ncbi:hypothetical protein HYS82_02985 [Candidatus Amesbacteria bacterium]|nr:hypothetical protein [Candidatus Amesbacteria bacterium]MBI2587636.1 hypothetical protein [Candidatus Amesbacteria bacterium]
MKKEVFLAVAIGFGLGLVITFGIWTANKSLKESQLTRPSPTPEPTSTPTSSISPSPSSPVTVTLTVTSPEDESLVTKDTVTITGKTTANASVTIVSELGEQIISADSSGNFTADVELEGGYNNLTITAFDSAGNSNSQTITVTYTTAKV